IVPAKSRPITGNRARRLAGCNFPMPSPAVRWYHPAMATDQPKRSVWPTIFAGVVLLAAVYGATYWWLMEPVRYAESVAPDSEWARVFLGPSYAHSSLEILFRPAFWLDKNVVRPDFWWSRTLW